MEKLLSFAEGWLVQGSTSEPASRINSATESHRPMSRSWGDGDFGADEGHNPDDDDNNIDAGLDGSINMSMSMCGVPLNAGSLHAGETAHFRSNFGFSSSSSSSSFFADEVAHIRVGYVFNDPVTDNEGDGRMVRILDGCTDSIDWEIYESLLYHEAQLQRECDTTPNRLATSAYLEDIMDDVNEDPAFGIEISNPQDITDICFGEDNTAELNFTNSANKRQRVHTAICTATPLSAEKVYMEPSRIFLTESPLSPILPVGSSSTANSLHSPILLPEEISPSSPSCFEQASQHDSCFDTGIANSQLMDVRQKTNSSRVHSCGGFVHGSLAEEVALPEVEFTLKMSAEALPEHHFDEVGGWSQDCPAVYDKTLSSSSQKPLQVPVDQVLVDHREYHGSPSAPIMQTQYFMYEDSFTESQHSPLLVRNDQSVTSSSSISLVVPKFDVNNVSMTLEGATDTAETEDGRNTASVILSCTTSAVFNVSEGAANSCGPDPLVLSSWPSGIWQRVKIPICLPSPELISRHCNGCILYWTKDCFYVKDNLALAAAVSLATMLKLPVVVVAIVPVGVYEDANDIVSEYGADNVNHQPTTPLKANVHFIPHRSSALVSFRRKSAVYLARLNKFREQLCEQDNLANITFCAIHRNSSKNSRADCCDILQMLHHNLLFGLFCVFTDDTHHPLHLAECTSFREQVAECPLFMVDSSSVLAPRSLEPDLHRSKADDGRLGIINDDLTSSLSSRCSLVANGLYAGRVREQIFASVVDCPFRIGSAELDPELQAGISAEMSSLLERQSEKYRAVGWETLRHPAIQRFIDRTCDKTVRACLLNEFHTGKFGSLEPLQPQSFSSVMGCIHLNGFMSYRCLFDLIRESGVFGSSEVNGLEALIADVEFSKYRTLKCDLSVRHVGQASVVVPWLDLLPPHVVDDVDFIHTAIIKMRNANQVPDRSGTGSTAPLSSKSCAPEARRISIYQTPKITLRSSASTATNVAKYGKTLTTDCPSRGENVEKGDVNKIYPILSFPSKFRTGATSDRLFNAIQRSFAMRGVAPSNALALYWCTYYLTHCGGDMLVGIRACLTELATHSIALVETENATLIPFFIFLIAECVVPYIRRSVQQHEESGRIIDPLYELYTIIETQFGGELKLQQYIGFHVAD
jgi:hypothetical protein